MVLIAADAGVPIRPEGLGTAASADDPPASPVLQSDAAGAATTSHRSEAPGR